MIFLLLAAIGSTAVLGAATGPRKRQTAVRHPSNTPYDVPCWRD